MREKSEVRMNSEGFILTSDSCLPSDFFLLSPVFLFPIQAKHVTVYSIPQYLPTKPENPWFIYEY
jgi:hypothetical protein